MASQNVINYKALNYLYRSNKSSMLYEIKSTRAVWDPSLSVPGTDRRGGWRCPEGARFGGQITDRFGRNCGWSLVRRLGRSMDNLGQTLREASSNLGATSRSAQRNASTAERRGRSVLNVIGRKLGFAVKGGEIKVSSGIEPSKFWSVFGDRPLGDDETKARIELMNRVIKRNTGVLERKLQTISDDSEFRNQRGELEKKIETLKGMLGIYIRDFASEPDDEKRKLKLENIVNFNQRLAAHENALGYVNGVIAFNTNMQTAARGVSRTEEETKPKKIDAKDLLAAIAEIDPLINRNGKRDKLVELLKEFLDTSSNSLTVDEMVDDAYQRGLNGAWEQVDAIANNIPIRPDEAMKRIQNPDADNSMLIYHLERIQDLLNEDTSPDLSTIGDHLARVIGVHISGLLLDKRIERKYPNGVDDLWEPPEPSSFIESHVVDRHLRPRVFEKSGSDAPDAAFIKKSGKDGVGPELIFHPSELNDVSLNQSDIRDNEDEIYAKLRLDAIQALKDFKEHKNLALIPRRHLFYVVKESGLFEEVWPDVDGNVGDTRMFALKSNPRVGFVFKRDTEHGWVDDTKMDEIFGHHFAAALGFPNGGAFRDGVDDYDDFHRGSSSPNSELKKRGFIAIPFAYRNIDPQYEEVDGWFDDNFDPGELAQVEDKALPARLYHLLAMFVLGKSDRHGGNAFGKAYDVDGEIVPLIMPIDFGGFQLSLGRDPNFFHFLDNAWLERLEDDGEMQANFPGIIASHMAELSKQEQSEFRDKMVQAFDLAIKRIETFIKNKESEKRKLIAAMRGDLPGAVIDDDGSYEASHLMDIVEKRLGALKTQREKILQGLLG